jgi:hypothetical protein
MEDLSGILVPKIPAKDGIPTLPQSVMDSFSAQAVTDHAIKLMGFEGNEEAPGEGS